MRKIHIFGLIFLLLVGIVVAANAPSAQLWADNSTVQGNAIINVKSS